MSDLVRAIRDGFYGALYRDAGSEFAVKTGEKASWWRLADGSEDDISEELTPPAGQASDDPEPETPKPDAPKQEEKTKARSRVKAETVTAISAAPFADAPAPVVVSSGAGSVSGGVEPDWILPKGDTPVPADD